MKKSVVALLVIFFSYGANAQKKDKIVVPTVVKESFSINFPGLKPKTWEIKDNGEYVAGFIRNKKQSLAIFMGNGLLQETRQEEDISILSDAIKEDILKVEPDCKLRGADKIVTPDGKLMFGAVIEKNGRQMELIYDSLNHLIREE
jgi:hypothetical protein